MGQHPGPARFPQAQSGGGFVQQPLQMDRQFFTLPLGKDQPGVADDVGNLPGIAAHHRHSAGHRFDQHPAKLLLPVGLGAAGQHQHIQPPIEAGHPVAGDAPVPFYPIRHTQCLGQGA